MKTRKRILAAVLTAIMMISLLPANTFATETVGNGEAESAVEAVSVSTEEQDVETTVEDVSEDLTEETSIESSETDEVEETADPAAEETIETVEETVEQAEEAEAAAEPEKSSPVTLEKEGSDYVVTVTYDASALLPEGTDIMVKEIKETAKKYDSYYDQALEAVQKENEEAEEISYIRLFDISLVDGAGSKVEPKSAVDVQIRLKDVETVEESTQIVHFAGEEEIPEVIEPTTVENDTVAFATEGFSIYAVVTTGEFARLTVNFNVSEGNTTTMYVKQKDITDGNLNQVLYDPGVPVQDGKKFLGWTDNQNWTSLSIEQLEENAKTIDDVRSDVTATLNAGITDGQSVDYYPIMVNIFELYYQDEENNTFKTESLLSATDSATTTVDLAYTLTGGTATQNFIGWKVKGTDEPVYPNGTEITISQDTILVPAIGDGRWLWFDSNAGGAGVSEASYTAPQFVAAGGTPTEPAIPTRPGYTFDGWFDAAEGGNAFDFGKQLSEYTPDPDGYVWAYAHWTAKQDASYKVIIWAQKVTDDKDAADEDKTYDYVHTYEVSNAVAGTILDETELRKSSDKYFEKDNAFFGAGELQHGSTAFEYDRFEVVRGIGEDGNGVNPDDSTVVNVYYDRALFTIIFTGNGSQQYEHYYPVDGGENVYGLVDGEYVPLTVTVSNKRIKWSKIAGAGTAGSAGVPSSITQVKWSVKANGGNIYSDQVANVSDLLNQSGGSHLIDLPVGEGGTKAYYNHGSQYLYTTASTGTSSYCQLRWDIVADISYAYNGEPYTGQLYAKTTQTGEAYTGLYGQTMAQNGYTWPTPAGSAEAWHGLSWLEAFRGNLFGSATLGFGTDVGGIPNTIIAKPESNAATSTIIFWFEDKDVAGQYNEVDRVRFYFDTDSRYNITERILGAEFNGYQWTRSESMPSDWSFNVGSDGFTTDERGSNTYMHIRYKRAAYSIRFMQGNTEIKAIDGVKYEESLAGYQAQAPADSSVQVGDDEFFAGWYEDPEGNKRVNWNDRMPAGDKMIYAVVRHSQYHVFIDMDGGILPNAQRNEFWEVWGRTIDKTNFMNATKTDAQGNRYTLVGYYWDEAMTKPWNFDIPLSAEYLWHIYDDSDGEDPARTSDFFGPGNDDSGYPQCVGIFRLWAKWKNDSILSKGGLNIRYRNPDASDNLYVDSMHYADMSDVIAAQAPEEKDWPEGKRFDGWQLTEGKVYQPGDVFVADSDDAVIENDKYWITLTAVYVDKENRTPTHVTWYKNDGTGGYYHTDDNYSINEPITIYGTGEGQAIPTRAGYKFLGWAKDTERENAGDEPNTSTDETTANFLEYRNGKFYLPSTETEVTHVAADEILPYEAIYAIWESTQYYIYHSATGITETCDIPAGGKADITAKVTDKYIYGGYYEYDDNAGDKRGTVITKDPGTDVVIEKGHTYYLKEVDGNYLKPNVYLVSSKIHNGMIRNLYGFVDYDVRDDYTTGGLVITGKESDGEAFEGGEIEIFDPGDLTSGNIAVTQGDKELDPLTAKKLFGIDSAVYGYADLTGYIDFGRTLYIQGYYETKDGVRVTGIKTRVIQFAGEEPEYGYDVPRFTGWNGAGNTVCGLATVGSTCTPVSGGSSDGDEGQSEGGTHSISQGLTLRIAADVQTYTITKVCDPDVELQTVEEGCRTGEITVPEREGYYFGGWYTDGAFTSPADFSDVRSDMTVYARYIKAEDVSVSFTLKSSKSGTVTFNATVSVKGDIDLAGVTLTANGSESVLGSRSVKKTGSGKNVKYTTSYKGTAAVKGKSLSGSFAASLAWTTADGTAVSGPAYNCKYVIGKVTVK